MTELAASGKSDSIEKRLVIGCGYLGQRAATAWQQQGCTVFATTRRRLAEFRHLGLIPILADVTRSELVPALPSAQTVLIAVGIDRSSGATARDVYLTGLGNILRRLPTNNRLIYVSSTGVYRPAGDDEVDETVPPSPQDETGSALVEAERLLRSERPDAIVLRFAGIYGPGRLLRERAVMAGEPLPTNPDAWLNLIHVEDGVRAILAAECRGRPGEIYNIADGHPVRRGDFYRRLAEMLHAPPPTFLPPEAAERGSRRISNRKMQQELQVPLRYADYEAGLTSCLY